MPFKMQLFYKIETPPPKMQFTIKNCIFCKIYYKKKSLRIFIGFKNLSAKKDFSLFSICSQDLRLRLTPI